MTKIKPVRLFETGATRDANDGKLEYARFLSPAAIKRYCEYMNHHRKQSDGALRDPDNWKKGIPKQAYMDSMMRHVMELWQRQGGMETEQGLEDILCAIMFNAHGLLFETLAEHGAAETRPGK